MANQRKANDFRMEIGLREGEKWSEDKLSKIKSHAKDTDSKRTPEQRMWNAITSINFRMEEYANTAEIEIEKELTIEDFVVQYLDTLNINFKTFALAIDSSDANLKKYLKGDRKFNEELACRFGKFFHTSPLTWMRVQHKNDLLRLCRISDESRYRKYDFEKVVR